MRKRNPINRSINLYLGRWFLLLYILVIFLTLPFAPQLIRSLYTLFGKSITGWIITGVIFLAIFGTLWSLRRLEKNRLWMAILPLSGVTLLLLLLDNPVERFHFLEYALLGYWLYLVRIPTNKWPLLISLLAVLIIGTLDEAIQWYLPNRYWDLRDIGMNGVGGGLGVWLAYLMDDL
ncbi:VanZ family protein [Magnetococcales bacterium HHB-1]